MGGWNKGTTLQSLVVPGGVLLAAVVLLESRSLPLPSSVVEFSYYAIFGAGVLLAWRFHSSCILFALITLLLAHRAIEFFAGGHGIASGPGHTAFAAIAFLLPLNLMLVAWLHERGLAFSAISSRLALLFLESVFVAVVARPGPKTGLSFLHHAFVDRHLSGWTKIPQLALLAFAVAFVVLLVRCLLYRRPVESGLLWALAATFLALQAGGVGRVPSAYFATAGLILVGAIVETSYLMAYHDELTALPARRAFNEALLRLEDPYAVAILDIDHFKRFNDTYGHATGDQVLRMVAAKLAHVSGGGQAFRVGGEEFALLFPGKSLNEVVAHLELLRTAIEGSAFRVRWNRDRRTVRRGPDRRQTTAPRRRMQRTSSAAEKASDHLVSVTVSIGVAEPTAGTRDVDQVIRAADKALYRAKQAGRNRVETAAPRTRASRAAKRSIA